MQPIQVMQPPCALAALPKFSVVGSAAGKLPLRRERWFCKPKVYLCLIL